MRAPHLETGEQQVDGVLHQILQEDEIHARAVGRHLHETLYYPYGYLHPRVVQLPVPLHLHCKIQRVVRYEREGM
ncbi:hypothetical protein SDC9_138554 [bioreactor metagenome]|uniref:Uncharacterized protein n=1 Tax=bioreactor metagenome TaxID=1076179 RepID=A0A645DQ85_9ZZZZ